VGLQYLEELKYPKALELFEKALKEQLKVHGPAHEDTARIYNSLASLHYDMAYYDEAEECCRHAIVASGDDSEKNGESYGTFCNNLGLVYLMKGNFTEALKLFQKALVIYEKILGGEHPHKAATYNNIAGVYKNQGNYDEAFAWYMKALAICEKVPGGDHPDTAVTYNNIASVYSEQGNHDEAFAEHKKALVIREKILGREHPDTATTYNNIAAVYHALGKYDEAMLWYGKAQMIWGKVWRFDHPHNVILRENIAECERRRAEETVR
jgi:tetratricopeptide (TPR) repeat protein